MIQYLYDYGVSVISVVNKMQDVTPIKDDDTTIFEELPEDGDIEKPLSENLAYDVLQTSSVISSHSNAHEEDAIKPIEQDNFVYSNIFETEPVDYNDLSSIDKVNAAIENFHKVDLLDKDIVAKTILEKYKEFNMSTKIGTDNPLYEYVDNDMKNVIYDDDDEAVTIFDKSLSQDENTENDDIGLPRLSLFPVQSVCEVYNAIINFSCVKTNTDRKILSECIIKRCAALNLKPKIYHNNPLYRYVPKHMQVSKINESGTLAIYGFDKPVQRLTDKERFIEHLEMNSLFYNTLFYTDDYKDTIASLDQYKFLNYLYPSFKTMNFYTRTLSAIGGLYHDKLFAEEIKKYNKANLVHELDDSSIISVYYDQSKNWYGDGDCSADHILFCCKLYDMVRAISNKTIAVRTVNKDYYQLLVDWRTLIEYHYAALMECEKYSEDYFSHCQFLHDLLWDPLDNPNDSEVISMNILSFIREINIKTLVSTINEDTLIIKQNLASYIAKELNNDDIFLLPTLLKYPIISQQSVRMAMDCIDSISKEDIPTYVENLNKKYEELGCTFSISNNHPYAKYVDYRMARDVVSFLNEDIKEDDELDLENEKTFYDSTEYDYYDTLNITNITGVKDEV